jgi:hypothetical protein
MPKPGFQQRVDGHGGQARDGLVNPRGGRQAAGGDRRQDRGGGSCAGAAGRRAIFRMNVKICRYATSIMIQGTCPPTAKRQRLRGTGSPCMVLVYLVRTFTIFRS